MIRFEGKEYLIIREFNCRVLNLENECGGGYFTTIPISPLDYRQVHQTKAAVKIVTKDSETIFHITDDWGTEKTVSVDNTHAEEIEAAIEAAKEQQLTNKG